MCERWWKWNLILDTWKELLQIVNILSLLAYHTSRGKWVWSGRSWPIMTARRPHFLSLQLIVSIIACCVCSQDATHILVQCPLHTSVPVCSLWLVACVLGILMLCVSKTSLCSCKPYTVLWLLCILYITEPLTGTTSLIKLGGGGAIYPGEMEI